MNYVIIIKRTHCNSKLEKKIKNGCYEKKYCNFLQHRLKKRHINMAFFKKGENTLGIGKEFVHLRNVHVFVDRVWFTDRMPSF